MNNRVYFNTDGRVLSNKQWTAKMSTERKYLTKLPACCNTMYQRLRNSSYGFKLTRVKDVPRELGEPFMYKLDKDYHCLTVYDSFKGDVVNFCPFCGTSVPDMVNIKKRKGSIKSDSWIN